MELRPASSFGWPAPRPTCCPLDSERGALLPAWEDALARYPAACAKFEPAGAPAA